MAMMTAITMKIPKPIPALKIPAIASQEVSKNGSIRKTTNVRTPDLFKE